MVSNLVILLSAMLRMVSCLLMANFFISSSGRLLMERSSCLSCCSWGKLSSEVRSHSLRMSSSMFLHCSIIFFISGVIFPIFSVLRSSCVIYSIGFPISLIFLLRMLSGPLLEWVAVVLLPLLTDAFMLSSWCLWQILNG